jgi:integrase
MRHRANGRGRAPNGSGQLIWREARQRWELRFSEPGKGCRTIGYYSVVRYGTKRAAELKGESKRRTLCGDLAAGRLALSHGKTVADVVNECLARRSGQVDVTTRGYENRAKHIRRHLGSIKLSKLTGAQIAEFYVTLETKPQPPKNKPLKPKTIRHIIGVLNRALDLAVAQGELRGNPIRLERIRAPRLRKKMYQIFTAEEIERILAGARDIADEAPWLRAALILMARCALRPGETMALKRSDFRGDTVTIQRSIGTLDVVKTDAGCRTIVVDSSVRSAVDDWLDTCAESAWVFPSLQSCWSACICGIAARTTFDIRRLPTPSPMRGSPMVSAFRTSLRGRDTVARAPHSTTTRISCRLIREWWSPWRGRTGRSCSGSLRREPRVVNPERSRIEKRCSFRHRSGCIS